MDESFDPYLKWLGIQPKDQPPHHYRLLGIETFESDPEVISNMADQRMVHLKNFAAGRHSGLSQKILNEIAAARVCLLNEARKARYDATLRQHLQQRKPSTARGAPVAAVATATVRSGQAPAVEVDTGRHGDRLTSGRPYATRSNTRLVWVGAVGMLALCALGLYASGVFRRADPRQTNLTNSDKSENNNTVGPPQLPAAKQEAAKQEAAKQEATRQETAKQEAIRQEAAKQEDAKQEDAKQEAAKQEAARQSAARQAAIRQEAARQEAARQAAARQEAIRQEAARQEAIRQEAARREAEKSPKDVKIPPPKAEEIQASLKEIRNIYKDELGSAGTPRAKLQLADMLYSEGCDTVDDPVPQFALFELSTDMAIEGLDITRAFRSLDRMGATFDVNVLSMKADSLEKAAKVALQRTGTPEQNQQIVDISRRLYDQALGDLDLQTADKLVKIALRSARKLGDRPQILEIGDAAKSVSQLRQQAKLVGEAVEILETAPDDPEANLVVGSWDCFVTGDWPKGLPLLAKCGDAKLAKFAKRDMAKPKKAADQAATADGWWELAEKKSGVEKHRLSERASYWYKKALPGLSGLAKTRVEKRLQGAAGKAEQYALQFDGSKSHVVVNNFVYPGVTPITVEAIVKANSKLAYSASGNYAGRYQTVISNLNAAGLSLGSYHSSWNLYFYYAYKSSPYSSYMSTSARRIMSSTSLSTNRWTHLAGVFDGTNLRLYVDGQLQGSETIRGMHKASPLPFVIGANPGQVTGPDTVVVDKFFGGSIKAVRISNTVRYTQNFTPPSELTADSSAKLLFDCREGRGSKLKSVTGKKVFGVIKDAKWVKLKDG